jgi:acyl carrier protein
MSDQDTIAEIVTDVSPAIKIGQGDYDKSLFDLGLDSLDHATILLQVEEKFAVKIPDDRAEAMISVATIADFIANNRTA